MKILCHIWQKSAVILALAAALTACESNPYVWNDKARHSVDSSLEDSKNTDRKKEASSVPKEVSQSLLPPFQVRPPNGKVVPLEPRFDLAVNNAPARQVFMSLVEGTPYSMVVHPDVTGGITLNLKNVTVAEALRSIRDAYGYDYRREGNRYIILGPGMQTRIFAVNYLNMNRKGKSDVRVSTGELTRAVGAGAQGAGGGGGSPGQLQSSAIDNIKVETDSVTDFWKDLRTTLMTLIGISDSPAGGAATTGEANERRVIVDPQSGYVIVRAMPEDLRVVEDYLERTQLAVNRQVMLEAKIVNVTLNDGYQTGVNWAKLQGASTFSQVGGGTIFNSGGVSEIAGQTPVNIVPIPPSGSGTNVNGTLATAFGGVFSIATQTKDFTSFVELLKTQGDVHVLSSPRVSTINNQKAVIKVGGDEFFVTAVTSTPSGVVGVPPTNTIELTPFFSGVALDVTPQIDDDDNIVLHIHPSVSEVVQRNKTMTINGAITSLPLAVSSIQESDNVVRSQSGQVIIIGGLMKEETVDNNAGIPFLSDIPILGNAFKHKQVTRVKNELIIMLKPTVVENNQNRMWADSIEDAQERIRKLRKP